MGLAHDHQHDGHRHDGRARKAGVGHEHRHRERGRLIWTMVVTLVILVAEIVGGVLSHSQALLSDAGHMLSDVLAQGLSLAALLVASRPADARRTYGWYRIEILAALLSGLSLFFLAAWVLIQGWSRLQAPVEIQTTTMLIVAGIGLLANLVGAWLLHGAHTLNVKGAYLHILLDLLSSVAVLIGGAIMLLAHGLYVVDPLLSMAIGLLILYSAYRLVRDAVDVLLEAVPPGIDLAGVTHAIDCVDGVSNVHDLHIWTITSGLLALSAHLVVKPGHTAEHDALLNRVKEMLLRDFAIAHTTLQIESAEYEHVGHVC